MESRRWYALVKFVRDSTTEIVLVKKIQNVDRTPFEPRSVNDFSNKELYRVKTALGSPEGKENRHWALIGRIEVSKEDLNRSISTRRVKWPVSVADVIDDPDNTSQVEEDGGERNPAILSEKVENLENKKRKRKAYQNGMEKFLMGNTLRDDDLNATETSLSVPRSEVDRIKENYERRIAELELKLKNTSPDASSPSDNLRALLANMEERIVARVRSAEEGLQLQIAEIKKMSTEPGTPSRSADTPGSSDHMPKKKKSKVLMGFGYEIESLCAATMKTTTAKAVWANALLVGVFGEERSKNLSLYPRNVGKEKMPMTFLSLAKDEFKKFLERNGRDVESADSVKELRSLPAYISARSYDMSGARSAKLREQKLRVCSKEVDQNDPATTSAEQERTIGQAEDGEVEKLLYTNIV